VYTTAHEIANKLREIADRFDAQPELQLESASLHFHPYGKQHFLNTVSLMPRPFKKSVPSWDDESIQIEHENDAVKVYATAKRKLACRLITPAQPAVYDCDPLLSQAEEDALSEPGLGPQGLDSIEVRQ
jgi:hypothetical protein